MAKTPGYKDQDSLEKRMVKDEAYDYKTFLTYDTGETKSIDFQMVGGDRQDFPYSHYMTSWLTTEDSQRMIKIFFATHLVTIKGYCLDKIYEHIRKKDLSVLRANDERYLDQVDEKEPFVTKIEIDWRSNLTEKE